MAMTLSEFRQQYPQYDDIDDDTLTTKLHDKYYSDIPFEEFSSKFRGDTALPQPVKERAVAQRATQEPAQAKLAPEQIQESVLGAAKGAEYDRDFIAQSDPYDEAPMAARLNVNPDEAAAKQMDQFINSGQYTPQELGISQELFDLRKKPEKAPVDAAATKKSLDEANYLSLLAENPQAAAAAYPEQEQARQAAGQPQPMTDEERAQRAKNGWLKYWGKSIATGIDNTIEGWKMSPAAAQRQGMSDRLVGQQLLSQMEDEYGSLEPEAKRVLVDTAAVRGQSVEEMVQQTADTMISAATKEGESLSKVLDNVKALEASKPISADTTTLGHYADLLIQNSTQAAYITLGMLLRSPGLVMSAMGTEIYGKEYGARRLEGRTHEQAHADALSAVVIEGVTEGIPVSNALKLINQGKRSKLGRFIEVGATEFSQEVLAEAAAIGYDWGIIGDDITMSEAFSRLTDAGVVGMAMGTIMSTPALAMMDSDLQNASERVQEATQKLKRLALRAQNPKNPISGSEIRDAQQELAAAIKAKGKLLEERVEAEKAKKAKKDEKKETKRRKKLTPLQVKREDAQKKQAEADQTLTGVPAEQDLTMADTMEKIGAGTLTEEDAQGVETLLDAGYAKVMPSGAVALLPAGKKRLEAVRAAQTTMEQGEGMQDEVIEPVPYTRPPETPVSARPVKIKEKPYKTPERRRAELMERVDEKVKDEETRTRIADEIIKAEQEAEMIEKREAELAQQQEKQRDKDYMKAVQQVQQEEQDLAEGLIAMDEKSISGYQGTQLGDILRSAMETLTQEETKAKEALKDAFWNKPVQGQLFDVTTVLAKGTKDYANLVKVGALKIAKVGLKYSAWSADMVGEFGESIKPVLAKVWHDSKKRVRDIVRISHERFESGERKGELKYSPKQYAAGKKIDALRKQLERLAKEGETGRYWYERTGQAILRVTGRDKSESRKLAGLLAIYSSGTAVGANLTNALKMWSMYKAGDLKMPKKGTKAGRFGEQDRTAIEWLQSDETDEHFVERFGDKRFPFFQNIMREIDPDNYETGQGATIDLWMMRAFGYDTASPTTAQFAFATTEVKNLAEKLGWENQQVQAAIWVAIKARWEFIQKEAKAKSVAKGLASWTPGPNGTQVFDVKGETREEQIENEKAIIQLFRDVALSKSIRTIEKKLEESKMDFADFMERHYATISWEAEPSTKLGLNFDKLPLAEKLMLQAEIAEILTNPETGREYLAEWLGLLGADQFLGPGAWNMAVGAATQNTVLAPPKHKAKGAQVEPNTVAAMNGYAAILGFLLHQDAVAWHRPFHNVPMKDSNGGELIGVTLTPRQVSDLYKNIVRVAMARGIDPEVAMNWAPIALDGATRVLNFEDIGNREFHKIIATAFEATGLSGTFEVFQTDGDMITNDWIENPKGESYVQSIDQNQNPAVKEAFERAKRRFAAPIAKAYQRYAEKYQAGKTGQILVYPVDKAPKKPRKGHLRFRHFSKSKPDTISTEFFGTGIPGQERRRGGPPVISAYPDKGFTKESGLGPNEYVIDVPEANMYNMDLDPMNLKALAMEPQAIDINKNPISYRLDEAKFEEAIRDAGFDGYYRPDADGNVKGQARFFRDLPVQQDITVAASLQGGRTVKVTENMFDEYEFRQADGEVFYTDDPDDAIRAVRRVYGADTTVDIVDEDGVLIVSEPPVTIAPQTRLTLKLHPEEVSDKVEATNEFMEEMFEETEYNPISGIRLLNGNVNLDIEPRNGEIWLDAIVAHEPGKGQGTEGLQFVVELADKHGVTVNLFAEAFTEEGLRQEDLVKWYERYGFVKQNRGHMVRKPQNPTTMPAVEQPKRSSRAGYGLPLYQVNSIVDKFKAETGIENIIAVQATEDLPSEIYEIVATRGWAGRLKGLFVQTGAHGEVTLYVVAEAMYSQELNSWGEPSVDQLMETLLHEAVGHFGTRALLGKNYNRIMDRIIRDMPKEVDFRRRQAKYKRTRHGMRLAAEEVIAYAAGEELQGLDLSKIKVTMLDRVIAAIREFMMRMGWVKITRDDILNLIFRAADFTRRHDVATLQKRANIADKMSWAREVMGMVAYHGSPHEFTMFDLAKIGTGEGAQAFGYGLYFAESYGVADNYRMNLSDIRDMKTRDAANAIYDEMQRLGSDPFEMTREGFRALYATGPTTILDLVPKNVQDSLRKKYGGYIYEVDISDHSKEMMLDWDLPISKQTESVQSSLQSVLDSIVSQTPDNHRAHQFAKNFPIQKSQDTLGKEIYQTISNLMGGDKVASEMLLQAGIPGIKFLDQMSRTSPVKSGGGFIKPAIQAIKGEFKPTRNLVLFTTDIIGSVKRNGETVFSKRWRHEMQPDGSIKLIDPVGNQPRGTVLPTASPEVLAASPGIQSWSVGGQELDPNRRPTMLRRGRARSGIRPRTTVAPSLTAAPNLAKDRDADPDLDRFLNKIGHHKHNKLDSFKDWWDTHKGRWSRIFEIEVIDQYAGIRHAEQDLMIFGEESGYMSVRMAAGVDVMIRSALENGVPVWEPDGSVSFDTGSKGLIEILAPIGQNPEMLKMFEAFIVARRAKRLHHENRERLISREEIGAVFQYVREKRLYKLFNETQREMAEYKGRILDFAEDAGLIDSETRVMWENNDHVPFYRVLAKDKTGPFAGSRIGQVGKVIKHLRGGTETLKNPLESIVQNIGMLLEASVKNRAMADIVKNFNGTGIITKAPQAETSTALVDLKQVQDMLDEAGVSIDAVGRDMLKGIQKLYSLQAPTADNIVSVQENGHKQYYYVHDIGVMRGLEVHPKPQAFVEFVMRVMRVPKRVLTRAITLTPDFILKNWFRDMWHSWVLSRQGNVVPVYDSIKGWGHAIAQDKVFKDIMSGGGMFDSGYVNASDPNRTQIAMRKALLGAGRGNILDTPRKLARFYMRIANGAENAHRIAVYQKTLAATGSRKQALFETRDIMDFAVRGANPIVRILTETVPFWGARVQGLARVTKGMKEAPMMTFLRGMPILMASVALYCINRDDDRYKKLAEYEKRMYYHFFDVFEPGDHWRLPKPFEIGSLFSSIPEVLTEVILSDQPDRGRAMAKSIAFIFGETLSLYPQVQIVTPVAELMMNRDTFTQSPILTEWDQKQDPVTQYSKSSNFSLKWLAQHMPDDAPDFMRSPKQLEHLMRGYFGSMMDYGLVASDLLFANMLGAPPLPAMRYDEMPFVRAFRRNDPAKYDVYIDTLYTVLEQADRIYNSINEAEKIGDDEMAERLFNKNEALLDARENMDPARREIRKINKEMNEIYLDPDMTPTQKREELDALLQDRSDIAKDAYDYRPGGKLNTIDGGSPKRSVLDHIIGMTKKEQVDHLLAAEFPHTAILVNDMRISKDKLERIS